jgi:hypothetical protein
VVGPTIVAPIGVDGASVRELLSSEHSHVTHDELENVLASAFGNPGVNDVEDFIDTLGQVGAGILRALPAVLPVVGSLLGPVGTVAGGIAGASAAAGASVSKRGPARVKPSRRGRTSQPPPVGPAGATAALQLLALLFRPEVHQALIAMALGDVGRRSIRVNDTPVLLAAFPNLLAVLAQQAALEYDAAVEPAENAIPRYLLDEEGNPACDPVVPEERATRLWNLLHNDKDDADEMFANGAADVWLALTLEAWDEDDDVDWDEDE